MESTPKYCEVFTQLQRRTYHAQHFWLEPPNFDCQGTDQFMPFALFTTLQETCPFESRQPLVIRYINPIIFVRDSNKDCYEIC